MQFTKAVRENVGLLIGLAGGTGSGKTFSALRLASGIADGKPFAFIDTENKRGLHYADQFKFDHGDFQPPFSPENYAKAIMAADKAGYPVIVVDSMSHEWAGEGGVLEMQESELERLGGGEKVNMLSWAKPKGDHKRMVQRLLQVRAHVILCFRAEEKLEMVNERNQIAARIKGLEKDIAERGDEDKEELEEWKQILAELRVQIRSADDKTRIIPKRSSTGANGWMPISEKNLPFELTTSFLLTANHPGVPIPIKLQEQHRSLFPRGALIDENAGRRIAEWAAGETIQRPVPEPAKSQAAPTQQATPAQLLGMRWGKAYPKNQGESKEAFQQRFFSWASLKSGMTIATLADLDDEAIDRCNIVLDDIENN